MKKPILSLLLMLSIPLSGCETISDMGSKVSHSIEAIEMPKFSSAQQVFASDSAHTDSSGLVSVGGEGCPQIKGLQDLSSLTQFSSAGETLPDKMISETRFEKINSTCAVSANSVSVELALDFTGTLGPMGVKDLDGQANYTYPYFLSVISPDGRIMSKDVFALSMVYENGQIVFHRQDKLRQVIPLLSGQDSSKFQIMIGFQLSESELAYNRLKK